MTSVFDPDEHSLDAVAVLVETSYFKRPKSRDNLAETSQRLKSES